MLTVKTYKKSHQKNTLHMKTEMRNIMGENLSSKGIK